MLDFLFSAVGDGFSLTTLRQLCVCICLLQSDGSAMEGGGQGLKTRLERDTGVRVVVLTLAVQMVLQPQPCYHVRTTPPANSGARH